MREHALDVLEFPRVLERVAARATSEEGRRRILALRPGARLDEAAEELERVAATVRFLERDPHWAMPVVPDVRGALEALRVEGAVLEAEVLHRVGVLLTSSRVLRAALAEQGGEGEAELAHIRDLLVSYPELERGIQRCVDAEGQVLDTASPELKRIRGRLRGAHQRTVRKLEAFLRELPERYVVPDASVTLRNGRYVIPLRREGKREVGGIVHDESQTGATVFVEPPVAIGLMNEVQELKREELREVRRILERWSREVAALRDELEGALDALAAFDSLQARARTALEWEAHVPSLHEGRALTIERGRHPLLQEADADGVVPFDFRMEEHERAVVVSGPNTGGKTVFLKSVGLICTLAQSGVVPPVGRGTTLPVFGHFFADIGDEQSIVQSLSTFSAHLRNLVEIVEAADERSLVIIDEMGTGTDPAEGAALARAILEELVRRGATTLASSHLGALKQLDEPGSGIVNASLQFDTRRLEPTYRLVKGVPGRSYGLAIARRLGLPDTILKRAESYVDDEERRLEALLERIEAREREAERLLATLEEERSRLGRLAEAVEERERAVREAEAQARTKAHEEARRLLMEARAEVEAAIRQVREAAGDATAAQEAAREARRRVEQGAERHRREARRASRGAAGKAGAAGSLEPGDAVRLPAGGRGRVVELRGHRALVEAGAVRLEVPLEDLVPVEEPAAAARAGRGSWAGPAPDDVRTEVDLRGLRVDEVDLVVQRALDDALLNDLGELRIIHGKGTGALRQRVSELLKADPRVRAFRPGGVGEGGAGVTVATLGAGA